MEQAGRMGNVPAPVRDRLALLTEKYWR